MPSFQTPPDWWLSLSNLVQWLHWPAISALVAGAAWWRTGTLANRATLQDRQKAAVLVLAVRSATQKLNSVLEAFVTVDGYQIAYIPRAIDDLQMIPQISEIRLHDMPTVEMVEVLSDVRFWAHHIRTMTLDPEADAALTREQIQKAHVALTQYIAIMDSEIHRHVSRSTQKVISWSVGRPRKQAKHPRPPS